MVGKLQSAKRMSDALDRIRLTMGEIVARVDMPFCAGSRVWGVEDTIEHRIAEIDVTRCHIDLRSQHPCAVRKFAGAHATKKVVIFLAAPIAKSAVRPRLSQGTPTETHFLLRRVIDVSLSSTNEVFRPVVKLIEIIRSVMEVLAPIEA